MTKRERQDLVREARELCVEVSDMDKERIRRMLGHLQRRLDELAARAKAGNLSLEPYASDIQDRLYRAKRR
jgi:hypothetical protein